MKYYSSKTVTKMLGVTAQTLRNWDKLGLKITSYCFSFLIAYEIVNIFKINKNIKASIDSFIMAFYFFFLYVVLEKNIENRQSFYDVITNATNYDKITLIIGISICIILAILFVIIGLVKEINSDDKSI